MKATIKISEKDLTRATQLYCRFIYYKYFKYWVLSCICPIVLLIFAKIFIHVYYYFSRLLISISVFFIVSLISIFVGCLISYFIIIPYSTRRNFRICKLYREPFEIELKEDGIQFKTDDGKFILKWDHIYNLYQNQHYLLIVLSPSFSYIIPKSIITSSFDMETFIKIIESKISFKDEKNKNIKL